MKKNRAVFGILLILLLSLCLLASGEAADENIAVLSAESTAGKAVTASSLGETKGSYRSYPRGSNVKIFTFWNYGAASEPDAYFLDNGKVFGDVAFTYSGRSLEVRMSEGGTWLSAGFRNSGSWYFKLKNKNTTADVRKGSFSFYDSKGKVITFTVYNCPVLTLNTKVTRKNGQFTMTVSGSGKKYGLPVRYQFFIYKIKTGKLTGKYANSTGTITKKLAAPANYEYGVRPYIKLGSTTVYGHTFRMYRFANEKLTKLEYTGKTRTVK